MPKQARPTSRRPTSRTARIARAGALAASAATLLAIGPMAATSQPLAAPATASDAPRTLPAPPADGVMGFVVSEFVTPIVPGREPCPDGPVLKIRDAYLETLSPEERERLRRRENEAELTRRWHAYSFGPNGTNVCSQPEMFDRPLMRTVQSTTAFGMNLDGDDGDGSANGEGCAHANFTSPQGERGVDNQEYRALGCKLEWRTVDGMPSDNSVGMRQYMASGEWTQVILLRGVDSLENDPEVEVIYGNTPDRPVLDTMGRYLPGTSFTISNAPPRHRNTLRGRIENGVLTTAPQDILLTQTWGQGGARDIRGNRTRFDYRQGRLRLTFQPDGSVRGMLGGYRPIFDLIQSPAIGGAGSATTAGIDCAQELKTLRHLADGIKDPRTGQCTGVSSVIQVAAVPAFVNDIPAARGPAQRSATR